MEIYVRAHQAAEACGVLSERMKGVWDSTQQTHSICFSSLQVSRVIAVDFWGARKMGCADFHCLFMFVKWDGSRWVVSNSLQPQGLYSPWNSAGQSTGVGSLSLLQEIFPTQELNRGLLYCRWILYQLSHKGTPRILEWVAYPFSRVSSWLRNWTGVSCIADGFFTNWAIREAPFMFSDIV